MSQPEGVTQKGLAFTHNQVGAHDSFSDLVAADTAQEQD